MSEVQSLQDAESIIKAVQTQRTVYWFKVPKKLAAKAGVKKLGFVELQAHEELMCANRAVNSDNPEVSLGFELAKESLRYADDKQLSTGEGTTDIFWGGNLPGLSKIRQLVLGAYGHIHAPDKEDAKDFLESMETQIG